MKLTNNEFKIKEIMLDPYNPRFIEHANISQSELLTRILLTRDAKEILTSMISGIKWVNRIVVQSIDDLSNEIKNDLKDIEQFKYIIVEGNTRLACLKSGKISNINEDTTIPVLLAQKEEKETPHDFQNELRITQGIANVMVVKEWKPLAKARHLYRIFKQKQENYVVQDKVQELYKDISNELGIKLSEVRTGIIRYAIYNEIAKESDTLEESNWPFLEAFDQNEQIRSLIGMKKNSIRFEWEDEQTSETIEKQELLNTIPTIINSAVKEGIQAKQFRDIFKNFIKDEKSLEDIKSKIDKIIDDNEDTSWKDIEAGMEEGEEEQWKFELNLILKKLNNFPSAADWALNLENELNRIQEKIIKHLNTIKS
jgi:hypothetical protein